MLVVVLIALALLVWLLASRTRRDTGLPAGQVVYADTGGWSRLERPLFSAQLQLTGKPDYLVRQRDTVIPVEVKSGRAPASGPYPGHLYQLAAYCALVTEIYGRRPAYGLIHYADQTLRVNYTRELEADLRGLLAEMRVAAEADDVARSHASPARCRSCGFWDICDDALDA
jgi:CRISPR-associated exonuclease Cas4